MNVRQPEPVVLGLVVTWGDFLKKWMQERQELWTKNHLGITHTLRKLQGHLYILNYLREQVSKSFKISLLSVCKYSWLLDNAGLKFTGPLTRRVFPIDPSSSIDLTSPVQTQVVQGSADVWESKYMEGPTKVIGFSTVRWIFNSSCGWHP